MDNKSYDADELWEKKRGFNLRAEAILSDDKDILRQELQKRLFLNDLIKEPTSFTEYLVYEVLLKYLVGEDPFPNTTKAMKVNQGRPRITIPSEKIAYYTLRSSQRRTHKLLGISTKKIREEYSKYNFEILGDQGINWFLDAFKDKYEEEFLKDNNNYLEK